MGGGDFSHLALFCWLGLLHHSLQCTVVAWSRLQLFPGVLGWEEAHCKAAGMHTVPCLLLKLPKGICLHWLYLSLWLKVMLFVVLRETLGGGKESPWGLQWYVAIYSSNLLVLLHKARDEGLLTPGCECCTENQAPPHAKHTGINSLSDVGWGRTILLYRVSVIRQSFACELQIKIRRSNSHIFPRRSVGVCSTDRVACVSFFKEIFR